MDISTSKIESFHFIVVLKEATFECIAKNLKVAYTADSRDDAFIYVRKRFSEH